MSFLLLSLFLYAINNIIKMEMPDNKRRASLFCLILSAWIVVKKLSHVFNYHDCDSSIMFVTQTNSALTKICAFQISLVYISDLWQGRPLWEHLILAPGHEGHGFLHIIWLVLLNDGKVPYPV